MLKIYEQFERHCFYIFAVEGEEAYFSKEQNASVEEIFYCFTAKFDETLFRECYLVSEMTMLLDIQLNCHKWRDTISTSADLKLLPAPTLPM